MAISAGSQVPISTSLRSLVKGFVLTQRTDCKSHRTTEYYESNLRRFLWYAKQQQWPDNVCMITEWHIREFLGYIRTSAKRWGREGNGSELSSCKASSRTVHHYYAALRAFFNWVVREGLLTESPLAKIKVARPKAKVIKPYTHM